MAGDKRNFSWLKISPRGPLVIQVLLNVGGTRFQGMGAPLVSPVIFLIRKLSLELPGSRNPISASLATQELVKSGNCQPGPWQDLRKSLRKAPRLPQFLHRESLLVRLYLSSFHMPVVLREARKAKPELRPRIWYELP